MKLLVIYIFIASINIFSMEQKETGIPLEPLFPEIIDVPVIKDGFYSLPETPLCWNSFPETSPLHILQAPNSDNKIQALDSAVYSISAPFVAACETEKRRRYEREMLDAIEQDEKRLKQEAKEIGKEKKGLQEIYTNQNENARQPIKRTLRGLNVNDRENKFTDSEFIELRRLLKSKLIDQVPEKRVIATSTVRTQCTKCKNFFFKLDIHLKKSSCGK